MSQLKDAIRALHARKDRAYGGAWKRRGERISIVPNIARKVDRLSAFAADGSEMADESILDTAVDLNVYCLKYLLFLAEQESSLLGKLSLGKPALPLSDKKENFDQLVEAANYEEPGHTTFEELVALIAEVFEILWPVVESNAPLEERFALADTLREMSSRLVARVRLEQTAATERFIHNELP